jgi:hypothetical protein
MDKPWRGNRSFRSRFGATVALAGWIPAWLAAATAILECSSAVRREGEVRFSFRPTPAVRLKPEKATLLLHVASGEAPKLLEVRSPKRMRLEAMAQEKGWVTAQLPAGLAAALLKNPEAWLVVAESEGLRFDLASRKETAPYLVVEGEAEGP